VYRASLRAEVIDLVLGDAEATEAANELPQPEIEAAKRIADQTSSDGQRVDVLVGELIMRYRARRTAAEPDRNVGAGEPKAERIEVSSEITDDADLPLFSQLDSGAATTNASSNTNDPEPVIERQSEIVAGGVEGIGKASLQSKQCGTDSMVREPKIKLPGLSQKDIDEIVQRLPYTHGKRVAKLVDQGLMLVPEIALQKSTADGVVSRLQHSLDTVQQTVVLGVLNHKPSDSMLKKLKTWSRRMFGTKN
jgi:hypothetical protein